MGNRYANPISLKLDGVEEGRTVGGEEKTAAAFHPEALVAGRVSGETSGSVFLLVLAPRCPLTVADLETMG